MILNSPTISGSLTVTGNIITSGSITISGSIASASYASNADLLDGLDSTVFTLTSSFNAQTASFTAFTASLNAFSASINTATSSFSGRVGALESYTASLNLKTASFATTGSNNFTSTQHIADTTNPTGFDTTASLYSEGGLGIKKDAYISSSLYIKGNLTVYGTQSVSYITSSQLNISTNLITVNTATPSVRFGGIAVQDSGSAGGLTGSLLWDSQNNSWLYNNPSGSGNYDSAMVIMGPRNSSALGSEVGLNCNYLVKGHGHHHTTSSGIFEDGNGNVGINCSTPNYKLHINGCTSIDGNLRMGSGYSSGNSTDPGITVQGFTNAGMYFSNCGVGLGAGSSSKSLLLTSYGGVLIGTEAGSFGKLSVLCGDDTPISSTVWGTPGLCNSSISVYNTSQCVNSVAGFKLITRNSGASTWSIYNISTGASTGDLAFGHGSGGTGCELLRIVSSGNVGINNTTPCGKLQITLGTVAGGCFRTSAGGEAALTIEACSNSYIQFMNCSNAQTGFMFGNNCTAYSGMIWYRHDQKQLMLGAGGTETMYICGGNVGIGISNPGATLDVYGTAKVAGVLTLGSSTSTSGLVISSNQTALKINGSTGYARGFLAFSWDVSPDIGTIFGCSLGFNTNATVGTNAGTRALTIDSTGITCFSQKPSFPGATLTCTYTCTYSSYTAGCWLGLFAGDNGYNGAYAFTVVGQFNLGGSAMYSINFATVPYIHKSTSIEATNGNDFYGIAHTSAGHADNGALVCFRRVRYSSNTPVGNRTEFCMNVSYSTSFTATTYVLAWV